MVKIYFPIIKRNIKLLWSSYLTNPNLQIVIHIHLYYNFKSPPKNLFWWCFLDTPVTIEVLNKYCFEVVTNLYFNYYELFVRDQNHPNKLLIANRLVLFHLFPYVQKFIKLQID